MSYAVYVIAEPAVHINFDTAWRISCHPFSLFRPKWSDTRTRATVCRSRVWATPRSPYWLRAMSATPARNGSCAANSSGRPANTNPFWNPCAYLLICLKNGKRIARSRMWIRETWTSQVYVKKKKKQEKEKEKRRSRRMCEVIICLASDENSKRTNRENKKKRTTDTKTDSVNHGLECACCRRIRAEKRIEMVRAKQTSLADSRDSRGIARNSILIH